MIYNKYLVLTLSIYLIYYSLYKFKGESIWKKIFIIASIGAIIGSISEILGENFYYLREPIRHLVAIPIFIGLAFMLYLLTIYAWRKRKNPKERFSAYVWLVTLALSIIGIVIIMILARTGFFG